MTQNTSSRDLIFFVSQRVDESKARMAEDLHALRAAVRRVLEAEDNIKAYQDYAIEHARKHPLALAEGLIEMRRVRSAEAAHKAALVGLRAEMAGIDGGKEQKL